MSDADLRSTGASGYRPGAQARSVATTRRLLVAVWDEMVDRPAEPVRLQDVLRRSGVSPSSFYDRFEGVRPLVELAGLLRLAAERRDRFGIGGFDHDADATVSLAPPDAAARVVGDLGAAFTPPGGVPGEVLSVGVWSDEYIEQRSVDRSRWLRSSAGRLSAAAGGTSGSGSEETYRRALTLCHLVAAHLEQSRMISALVVPEGEAAAQRRDLEVLARLLFDPGPDDWAAAATLADAAPGPRVHDALSGRSERHATTVDELREATRVRLVADGLDLHVGEIAASAHRSPASFFDTFGSVGAALADLATAKDVAALPPVLFRPRPGLTAAGLIEHLVWRIGSWQNAQGVTGRRLLQVAGRYPEVARVVVGQTRASADLLVRSYASMFRLPSALTRLVFEAILLLHQHQVLWGQAPPVVTGSLALRDLFAPVMADAP